MPEPVLTTGLRVKRLRLARGMTQEVFAGLIGKSPSWVKSLETGRLQTPKLSVLLQIAQALRVQDIAELTGDHHPLPTRIFTGPGHAALDNVRAAINAFPLHTSGITGAVQPLGTLRARLDRAWAIRHGSPDHRTALGELLPDLIRDTQLAAAMYDGDTRREAHAILSQTYGLAQMYLAYQPAQDLLWRVAERAMSAAQESRDPCSIAGAAWFLTQAHRDSGEFDAARDVNRDVMAAIAGDVDGDDVDLLAMWGALEYELGYTAARAGDAAQAWGHWDEAGRVADRLPAGYYQRWTSFSRVIMDAHAVTVSVELRQGGESARQAAHAYSAPIPSLPRRGRHLIEIARAHAIKRDHDAVLGTLTLAARVAPETIRYNGYARTLTHELSELPGYQSAAHALADEIGLML